MKTSIINGSEVSRLSVAIQKRALLELKKHGIEDATEFFNELNEKEHYDAQEVLRWLGY